MLCFHKPKLIRRDDEFAAQHIHSAGEREFTAFFGRKFNRRGLIGGQIFNNSKIAENDLLAAR